MLGSSPVAAQLAASQEGLSSMSDIYLVVGICTVLYYVCARARVHPLN
jgi:hypothetical protein